MFRKLLIGLVLVLFFHFNSTATFAQDQQNSRGEQFEGQVLSKDSTSEIKENNQNIQVQKIQILILNGRLAGQTIEVRDENFNSPHPENRNFSVGDQVIVGVNKGIDGNESFYISDYVRRTPLYLLFGLFLALVLFIARKKGFMSILGMVGSFAVIFLFVMPQISQGNNPVLVAILSAFFIIPLTFYSSHGFDRKTHAAVIGTFIALVITGLLAVFFVEATKLSGFAAEEAAFVKMTHGDAINIKGLLLAGIIIGLLGVLDDITVAQANIVYQLKQAAKHLTPGQLYSRAMEVGKDHIASMVNTLILVYTGAALPLLLLFVDNSAPFSEVINYEIVAEEIVRTLVASMGLIIAVPITTYIAAWMVSNEKD